MMEEVLLDILMHLWTECNNQGLKKKNCFSGCLEEVDSPSEQVTFCSHLPDGQAIINLSANYIIERAN